MIVLESVSKSFITSKKGDFVIVETSLGEQYTEVVVANKEVPETKLAAPLKPIIRKANNKDRKHHEENKKKEAEALSTAQKLINMCRCLIMK